MFNIFKKNRTKLFELIPNGFVDIHSHVLPGIDDGAKNMKESVELLTDMKKIGFSKIIATPHIYPGLYNNTKSSIEKSFQSIIKKIGFEIDIDYASEYLLENSIIEDAKNKSLLTLKDNYVLVELSYISAPINLDEILFQIQTNDYIPVLAHPERYVFFHNSFKKYTELKKRGCLFQINLLSTTGYYGNNVLKICDRLIKNGYVNFVGSDIHKKRHIQAFNNTVKLKYIDTLKEIIEKNEFFN